MKSKVLMFCVMILLVSSLAVIGCAEPAPAPETAPAPAPEVQPIELTWADPQPPGHVIIVTQEMWQKDIEQATNGRVKITFYHGGALLGPGELTKGCIEGVADIITECPGWVPGSFNVLEAFEIPGMGPASATSVCLALQEAHKTLKASQEEYNMLHVLWIGSMGSANLGTTNKPIRNLEDIKGMELRGSGITKDAIDALGAVGVAIPMPETYLSLEKGIVDGLAHPFETFISERHFDLIKYYTLCAIYPGYRGHMVMNLDKWNSLPSDIQKIIDEVSDGYWLVHGRNQDERHETAYGQCAEKGVEIIQLPPEEYARWLERWEPLQDKWAADMEAKGLPGREALDLTKQLLAKYYAQYPGNYPGPVVK